jgi:hypothetical protein
LETAIGFVLALPLGVLIGYQWRDRISRQRRTRYLVARLERERAKSALAMPAERERSPNLENPDTSTAAPPGGYEVRVEHDRAGRVEAANATCTINPIR